MTREKLEELVIFVRQHRSKGHPPYEAIVQLADERDRAVKRAEEAERQLAAVMEMRERDAPLWDRMGDVAKKLLGTNTVKLLDQRDRALSLLHRYVRGLPPQKPTSTDGDTQAFLAEIGYVGVPRTEHEC